jgi:hypothetical protein
VIVREEGERLILVRQADHAMLSGRLAAAWGAPPWQPPQPRDSVIVGARLHDLAWTAFDEALPRRPDGRPYAFHEVSRVISSRLYRRGLDAVEALDPYAALLDSLHYTGFYVSHWGWRHWARPSALEGEEREAVERFVADEVVRQRRLRDRLGVDRSRDSELRCNYLWLQLWDRISLDICRRGFAGWVEEYPAVRARPDLDAPEVRLRIELEPGGVCRLSPYPLLADGLTTQLPCVNLPRAGDVEATRLAWLAGGTETIRVTFRGGGQPARDGPR